MEENQVKEPTIVKLLVGERLFRIREDLLVQDEDTFFSKLLSDNWPDKQKDIIILERDYKYFPQILGHLESKPLKPENWSLSELESIRDEADFYCLTNFITELDQIIEERKKSFEIVVESGDRVMMFCNEGKSMMKQLLAIRARPAFVLWIMQNCWSYAGIRSRTLSATKIYRDFYILIKSETNRLSFYDPRKRELEVVSEIPSLPFDDTVWETALFTQVSDYYAAELSHAIGIFGSNTESCIREYSYQSKIQYATKDIKQEEIIKLLVGDKLFRVSKELLLRDENTFFGKLLSKDQPDIITINRGDKYFETILDHLDKRRFCSEKWLFTELVEIKEEAQFYCLSSFVDQLDLLIYKIGGRLGRYGQVSVHQRFYIMIYFNEESMMSFLKSIRCPTIVNYCRRDNHYSTDTWLGMNRMVSGLRFHFTLCTAEHKQGVYFYDPVNSLLNFISNDGTLNSDNQKWQLTVRKYLAEYFSALEKERVN